MRIMKNKKNKSGFTLIEVLAVMFIAAVIFTAFYTVSMVGTRFIIEAKNRLGANALANEKMEIIRNLEYDDVGIQGGIPDGNVPEDEDVTANSKAFHVHTFIQYVDDPLDGVFPADTIPDDYKVAKITVSWQDSKNQTQTVDLVSLFMPPGLETTAGGAPLAINVNGSDGSAVAQANVEIKNSSLTPAVDFTVQTDNTGHLMLPAAPASLGKYQITVSKGGYETVATVDPASVPYTPTYSNATVLLSALNSYDYIEDQLSNLTVQALDYQNNPAPSIQFSIVGGMIIGRDASNNSVYDMNTTGTGDATTGQKVYSQISPGNYAIAMSANAKYEFVDFDPSMSPLALVSGTSATYTLRVADKSIDALSLNIVDADTGAPIAGAQATLTDATSTAIFTNKLSSLRGVVFYPDVATPLLPGAYTLSVSADGYTTQTTSVTINKLTDVQIKLAKS